MASEALQAKVSVASRESVEPLELASEVSEVSAASTVPLVLVFQASTKLPALDLSATSRTLLATSPAPVLLISEASLA